MNRRRFIAAIAALGAAVGLGIKPEQPRVVKLMRCRKVYTGNLYISGETMRKLEAREGAFVEWAERALNESARAHMREVSRQMLG